MNYLSDVIIVLLSITIWLLLNQPAPPSLIIHTDILTLCGSMAKNSREQFQRAYKGELAAYDHAQESFSGECMRMLKP